jgi:hypothetical protein
LNRSMGVGLEGLLLTRLPSSFTWVVVPYSGDGGQAPATAASGRFPHRAIDLRLPPPRNRPARFG